MFIDEKQQQDNERGVNEQTGFITGRFGCKGIQFAAFDLDRKRLERFKRTRREIAEYRQAASLNRDSD